MAIDFLSVSRGYINSLDKRTRAKVLLRRSIVVSHLTEKYTAGREKNEQIIVELLNNKLECSIHTIRKDIEIYRLIYRYYVSEKGKEKISKRFNNKYDLAANVLKYFLEDGFDTWDKIVSAFKKKHGDAYETRGKAEAAASPKTVIVRKGEGELIKELRDLKGKVVSLEDEIRMLRDDLQRKDERNAVLKRLYEETRSILDTFDFGIDDISRAVSNLKKKLEAARSRSSRSGK